MHNDITAPVVDIRRNALDDGPGIRSLVFFKGCPLDCVWCHNPETKKGQPELMFAPSECILCKDCEVNCPQHGIDITRSRRIDRSLCDRCFTCVEICPSGAMKVVGKSYTVEKLAGELLRDEPFYRHSGGGVTYSGGEPTVHLDFLGALSQRLKTKNINLNIETCGLFDYARFGKLLLPYLDSIFFDLKIFDPARHREFTGVDNSTILANFERLAKSDIQILPRIPLIPGITDDEGNLKSFAAYLTNLGIKEIGLLEYNPTWITKGLGIGSELAYSRTTFMEKGGLEKAKGLFKGITIKK